LTLLECSGAVNANVGRVSVSGNHTPRRVLAWMSADCFNGSIPINCKGDDSDNTTDIMRQVKEAVLRRQEGSLTDVSPTTYAMNAYGVFYDRCGVVCERLQPELRRAGLRVFPLIVCWGIESVMGIVGDPEQAAANLVNLTLTHEYDGINIDFEPMDLYHCNISSNCIVETPLYLRFLNVVGSALHAHGKVGLARVRGSVASGRA
jgi:hypothetical protein